MTPLPVVPGGHHGGGDAVGAKPGEVQSEVDLRLGEEDPEHLLMVGGVQPLGDGHQLQRGEPQI